MARARLAVLAVAAIAAGAAACLGATHPGGAGARGAPTEPPKDEPACPPGMAHIETYCVDRWEDHVVEVDESGRERPHSPYERPNGKKLRAKTGQGVVPQAYLSLVEAQAACAASGKRLCTSEEFMRACRGPNADDWFPYGGRLPQEGLCNVDRPNIGIQVLHGGDANKWSMDDFNDPRLNQLPGGLAKTGAFPRCVSPDGAYDMVGNLHEWVDDPEDEYGHARFRGGWYGEASRNGPGCLYVTVAHEQEYHDYSIGFRCCKDAFD